MNSAIRIWITILFAFLSIQFLAALFLGGDGFPSVNPDALTLGGYIANFKPHIVLLYLSGTFIFTLVISKGAGRVIPSLKIFQTTLLPIGIFLVYICVLLAFIGTRRIYFDPNFREGLVHIDPFAIFALPYILGGTFLVVPIMILFLIRHVLHHNKII